MAPKKRKRPAKVPPPKPAGPPPPPPVAEAIAEVVDPEIPPPGGAITTSTKTKRRPKVPVTVEAPGTALAKSGEDPEAPSRQYLRFAAGLAYTTDVNGVTVEELSKRAPYAGVVPFATMQHWSVADQWVARREALAAQWRKSIEEKLGQRAVQNALSDLGCTDELMRRALKKLRKKALGANSFEGVMNAVVRLMEFRGDLRNQVLTSMAPVMGTAEQEGGRTAAQMPATKLSVEDARAAASAIIRQRRERIRAEQALLEAEAVKKKAEEKPQEAPALRLVPGEKG